MDFDHILGESQQLFVCLLPGGDQDDSGPQCIQTQNKHVGPKCIVPVQEKSNIFGVFSIYDFFA